MTEQLMTTYFLPIQRLWYGDSISLPCAGDMRWMGTVRMKGL